jgi:hypothetical protein
MMDGILLLLFSSSVFAVFYRKRLAEMASKPKAHELVQTAVFLIFAAACAVFKYAPFDGVHMVPVMWAGALAVYNYYSAPKSAVLYLFYLILISSFFSVLILPVTKLTPYIFMPVMFVALFFTAAMYGSILERSGLKAAFAFMLFSVFSVKYLMLGYLSPFISAPVSACFGMFFIFRKGRPVEHYIDEKNAYGVLGVVYPVFMLQCLAAALLKNSLFF